MLDCKVDVNVHTQDQIRLSHRHSKLVGRNPLRLATERGDKQLTELFLNAGADVNQPMPLLNGKNNLHLVVGTFDMGYKLMPLLLQYGGDLTIRDAVSHCHCPLWGDAQSYLMLVCCMQNGNNSVDLCHDEARRATVRRMVHSYNNAIDIAPAALTCLVPNETGV